MLKDHLILGIDETHKSDAIGSIFVCGFICKNSEWDKLYKIGVKDSKRLTKKEITEVAGRISHYKHKIYRITAGELSRSDNIIISEAKYINSLIAFGMLNGVKRVFIDSMTANTDLTKQYVLRGKQIGNMEIKIETHADEHYIPVGAASILAKDASNKEMEELRKRFNCGSGVPNDPKTREFIYKSIKENDKEALSIIRKNWVTFRRELENIKNDASKVNLDKADSLPVVTG